MSIQLTARPHAAYVIVVGNEKGGSGKSTIAMHLAIALMKRRQQVATVDLDARQRSFTHYVESRRAWAEHIARELEIPEHVCFDEKIDAADDGLAACHAFADKLDALADNNDFLIIDTPGHDSPLTRLAHATANTLITPLNDSFVDLDVLGTIDSTTFGVTGGGHYARMVEEVREARRQLDRSPTDWIVMRNRLSMLNSRNKRLMNEGLQELSHRLNFRYVDGLAERMIFRELYPRGLTAMDDLDARTLGMRPTISHATARMEIETLLAAMGLGEVSAEDGGDAQNRDAA